jgi:hypothetical protein
MAQKREERRMLFDTSGRRKRVIQVVYAILALLMGASLFLVIGPFNLGELVGNSSGGAGSASQVFDEQVERIEGRLARNPRDEQLLLTLTRAEINAGNARLEPGAEGEVPKVTPDAQDHFEAASEAWNRYLKQAGEDPSPAAAQLIGQTFFQLAESSASLLQSVEFIARATKAQRIAAEEQPTANALSTLAIYEYFNGNYAAGDKVAKRVTAMASSKAEVEGVEKQLNEYRSRSKQFDRQKKELERVQRQANKEQLQNPLGGIGGAGESPGG